MSKLDELAREIEAARETGDYNYEDELLLKFFAEATKPPEPKKLIIFREQGMGGVLYNINSNVKFDEVITVDQLDASLIPSSEKVEDHDWVESLSVDGDYGSASWLLPLEQLERRIAHWKARQKELELKREENE